MEESARKDLERRIIPVYTELLGDAKAQEIQAMANALLVPEAFIVDQEKTGYWFDVRANYSKIDIDEQGRVITENGEIDVAPIIKVPGKDLEPDEEARSYITSFNRFMLYTLHQTPLKFQRDLLFNHYAKGEEIFSSCDFVKKTLESDLPRITKKRDIALMCLMFDSMAHHNATVALDKKISERLGYAYQQENTHPAYSELDTEEELGQRFKFLVFGNPFYDLLDSDTIQRLLESQFEIPCDNQFSRNYLDSFNKIKINRIPITSLTS
jgi:hypothetical protein